MVEHDGFDLGSHSHFPEPIQKQPWKKVLVAVED
jgi:hypothetical protein